MKHEARTPSNTTKLVLVAEDQVPVTLVTAHVESGMRDAALKRGAVALLEKPIDAITLGRHLERAAERNPSV